jgi:RimJ/RimL family protein N-acetyltransferase
MWRPAGKPPGTMTTGCASTSSATHRAVVFDATDTHRAETRAMTRGLGACRQAGENGMIRCWSAGQDGGMLVDHFPLVGLRLTTPRLQLRLPSPEELGDLADLAAGGIHDPGVMPFAVAWTDRPPAEVALGVIQHYWRQLGAWTPQDWSLNLSVFHAGVLVGQQSIGAHDLATTREVNTGSWLGQPYQGQGIGTEMRAAVLHLAFTGLGAEEAISGAFEHNHASQAISQRLGYRPDGIQRHALRGALSVEHRFRLTRQAWEQHRSVPVSIEGLHPCLPLLGLDTP